MYLIDGSNFSRSFWSGREPSKTDALEAEFIQWLALVARTQPFKASCFRVVFDGGFRPIGAMAGPSINVYFSEDEKADEILFERGYFMRREAVRAMIVTSDHGIRDRAAAEDIKCMSCEAFFRLCDNELKKTDR